jgi:mono/diheme cytochrome c family protein
MRVQWMGLFCFSAAMLAVSTGCGGLGDCPSNSDAQQAEGKQIMTDNCVVCHSSQLTGAARGGAPVEYNFDNLSFVREEAEEIYEESESGSMPPAAPMSDAQLESFRVYLACGAK